MTEICFRRMWASLMQGTSTVIDAMQEWKDESQFGDFMEEKQIFCRTPFQPQIEDPERDKQVLNHIYDALKRLEPYVNGKAEEGKGLNDLINFVQNLQDYIPIRSPEDQFEHIYPLRAWLFFLPIDFVKRVERDPSVMILLAHFYGVALAVEPLFPAVGAAYFGTMSVGPIEEIHKTLMRQSTENTGSENLDWPISLMEFPLEMVREFRLRMGWRTMGEVNSPVESEHAGGMMDFEHDLNQVPMIKAEHGIKVLRSPLCAPMSGFDVSAFASFGMAQNPVITHLPNTPTSPGHLRGNWGN